MNDERTTCPVCDTRIDIPNLFQHVFFEHSEFLLVWASLMYPEAHPLHMEYIDGMHQDQDYRYDDYTYYSQLCDYIGYHRIGIKEIDDVAPVVCTPEACTCNYICVICLDNLCDCSKVRKIEACNHMYCAPCIETWLSENKTCPICKTILENS